MGISPDFLVEYIIFFGKDALVFLDGLVLATSTS
jgi:hypothetical protein